MERGSRILAVECPIIPIPTNDTALRYASTFSLPIDSGVKYNPKCVSVHFFLRTDQFAVNSEYSPTLPWTTSIPTSFVDRVVFTFDGLLKTPEEVERPKMEVTFMDVDGAEAFHMVVDSHESTIHFTSKYMVCKIN